MSLENKLKYEFNFSGTHKIIYAFRLGLLWNRLPEWVREELEETYSWDNGAHFKIQIIADSATSWYEGYRSLREAGWERVEAKREGGLITYIMEYDYLSNYTDDPDYVPDQRLPEEFHKTRLQYQVTLPTCRQVKTGTKEVDVFETVCDDIQEPEDEGDHPDFVSEPNADDDENSANGSFNETETEITDEEGDEDDDE